MSIIMEMSVMHGERLFMCRRAFVDSKPEEQQLKKPISRR